MDADEQFKFDFFKDKDKDKDKDSLLKGKYQKKIVIFFLLLNPLFIGSILYPSNANKDFIKYKSYSEVHPGYMSFIKSMDSQESFIDVLQSLDLTDVKTTIKEIQKIGFVAKNISSGDKMLYVIGYRDLTGMMATAILSSDKDKIKVTWLDVSSKSIFLSSQWDHESYPVQIISSANKKNIDLVMNHIDLKETQKIKDLKQKVLTLSQENENLKKDLKIETVNK